jgi:hypothetical protein
VLVDQERQIVSIQPLVTVTLFRWPCRVQVGSKLPINNQLLNDNSVQSESLGVNLRTQIFETFQSTNNYNICQCS